jgi:hypothetical protein
VCRHLEPEEAAVKRFWPSGEDELGRELRANRPEFSDAFVRSVVERIEADGHRSRLYAASRLSFAAAITVLALGTLVSFGGLGYAASGTWDAVKSVKRVVVSPKPRRIVDSAAQAQYAQPKVTICHKGHTITIARAALPAHLRQGDTIGPCPGGVAGAQATVVSGGALGATGSGGSLPFTGLSLGVTALVSLLLLALGIALRRSAARKD